jgi:hypothetical protein
MGAGEIKLNTRVILGHYQHFVTDSARWAVFHFAGKVPDGIESVPGSSSGRRRRNLLRRQDRDHEPGVVILICE